MKISLSLLKNYVDLNNLTPIEISEILTEAGIEVENIENENPSFSGVVSAKVEEVNPHPNADKLKIATIFDGQNRYQVICGASNCKKGMITAFAKSGALLTDGSGKKIQIKPCKLRNVDSFGMLCSKKELQLSGDSEGIIELSKDMALGLDLSTLVDPIFDISLTPNLGHCTSAIGIARELAALINKKLIYPSIQYSEDKTLSTSKKMKVEISDFNLCPRYSGLYIENITIQPSPSWLKNYLEGCSIRSLNNIVDIMNFVMVETGQPLHSFDCDKLSNEKIIVSSTKKEEKFLGLDSLERTITKDALVIRDSEKIVAIAGIIGGEESGVSDSTQNIFIESAFFNPLAIRKTSRMINLRTESSLRFEKTTDPDGTLFALKRAAHLIKMVCPSCRIAHDLIDLKMKEFSKDKIDCRISRINKLLGTKISLNEAIDIFQRLEIESKTISDDTLQTLVPTFRNDIKKEIDLIEEVARIYGYNNLEKKAPLFSSSTIANAPLYSFETRMKQFFTSQGMQELITSDLISPKLSKLIEERTMERSNIIEVLHAKSEEQSLLRSSLLPSLLQVVKNNHDHKNFDISAFEVSKIHYKKKDEFIEESTSAMVLSGKSRPHHWKEKPSDFDFFDLKGILENLFHYLKITNWMVKKSSHPSFHPGEQADIFIGDINVGAFGEVHPSILSEIDIKKPVFFAELNNHTLLKQERRDAKYKALPLFPSSERDWTISIKEDFDISSLLKKLQSPILEEAFIFDLYSPSKDEKKVTLRFIYRDKNKTVSFDEVNKEHLRLTSEIEKKLFE